MKTSENVANILIVDDVTSNLAILAQMIKSLGYIARPVTSVKQALLAIEVSMPQLILLDISMPDINGFEFCEMLKKDAATKEIPIIFISALNSAEDKIKGFQLGAVDFISKPFEIEEVTMRINTHLKSYRMHQELEVYNKHLHKVVNDQMVKMKAQQKSIIYALTNLSEAREDPSGKHLEHIRCNSKTLALALQLSPKFEKEINSAFIDNIEMASMLHDLGKIAIHDSILLKKGELTENEMTEVKKHTIIGANTLEEIMNGSEDDGFFKMATEIAHYHHEHWDGGGYPEGLSGTEIPLAARIVTVIDIYDALISEKCYKKAYSHEYSIELMKEESGKCFDPDILDVFLKIQNQIKRD